MGVADAIGTGVNVSVGVSVMVGVRVSVGVNVSVGVRVGVKVLVGVKVAVGGKVGVRLETGCAVGTAVATTAAIAGVTTTGMVAEKGVAAVDWQAANKASRHTMSNLRSIILTRLLRLVIIRETGWCSGRTRARFIRWTRGLPCQINKRLLVNFLSVIALIKIGVFQRVYGIAPTTETRLTQHRTAFIAAHNMARARNAYQAFHTRFDHQMTVTANRANLDGKTVSITISSSQSTPIKRHIGQHKKKQ